MLLPMPIRLHYDAVQWHRLALQAHPRCGYAWQLNLLSLLRRFMRRSLQKGMVSCLEQSRHMWTGEAADTCIQQQGQAPRGARNLQTRHTQDLLRAEAVSGSLMLAESCSNAHVDPWDVVPRYSGT